jgi:hypothetical protein
MAARRIGSRKKRQELRDRLWPGIADRVYPQPVEFGWCQLPRFFPLVLQLLSERRISNGMDLSRTFLGLWCDNYGDGMVEVDSEIEYAAVAGFRGDRGIRSWRDRVRKLAKLGFIEVTESGTQRIGFVCIIDPRRAIDGLPAKGISIPQGWWAQYQHKLITSGAFSGKTREDAAMHLDDAAPTPAPRVQTPMPDLGPQPPSDNAEDE